MSGETREDMLSTVRYLAALDPPPDGVKLQMLHVLRGTQLGEDYEKEPFPLLTLEEYAADARGVFAAYARKVLQRVKGASDTAGTSA